MRRFCVFAVLFLIAPVVSASYVTISVSILSDGFIAQSPGDVNLTVSNFGDEPAYDVQLSLLLPDGFHSEPVFVETVEPNGTVLARFGIPVSDGVPTGEYYADLMVQYSDANGYPFSMVNPVKLVYQKQAQSPIRGSMGNVEIPVGDSGTLSLKLTNLGDVPRELLVKLEVPHEIRVDAPERTVSVPQKGEIQIDFPVSSFGALSGSSYLVYAVASYTDGVRYSTLVRSTIGFTEKRAMIDSFPWWIPATAVVVLILVIAYLQLRPARPIKNGKTT